MEDDGVIECSKCPYKTDDMDLLYGHIQSHSVQKPSKCQHPQCPASFSTNSKLKVHQVVHTKEKNFECAICFKRYGLKSTLTQHVKKIHRSEWVRCSRCPYGATVEEDVIKHMMSIHPDEPEIECGERDYTTKSDFKLNLRLKVLPDSVEERKEKTHQCPDKSTQAGHLKDHIQTHTGERPFSSSDFKSITSSNLKGHIVRRHPAGSKFKCKLCDYSGVSRAQLNVHIRSHTGQIKKSYKCQFPDCLRVVANLHDLRKHELTHTDEKPFKCEHPKCSASFRQLENFQIHQMVHMQEKKFECSICSIKFDQKDDPMKHEKIHESEKSYKCGQCFYKSEREEDFNSHMNVHLDPVERESQCPATVSTDPSLNLNQSSIIEEKKFKCSVCFKKFSHRKDLMEHKKSHRRGTRFGCSLCSYRGKSVEHLESHINLNHADEKPFQCAECPYKGKSKDSLNSHNIRVHLDPVEKEKQMKHQCPHCPYKCIHIAHMKDHIRTHTGDRPFSCFQCDYKAIQATNLKLHIAKHHSGERKFKCQLCNYSTVSSGNLNVHIRSHTGEKPYKCQFTDCPYAALTSSALRRHQLIHRKGKEEPFKCGQCSYTTIRKKAFRNHEKIHHPPFPSHDKGIEEGTKRKGDQIVRMYRCPVDQCEFWSGAEDGLAFHLNDIHQLPSLLSSLN